LEVCYRAWSIVLKEFPFHVAFTRFDCEVHI